MCLYLDVTGVVVGNNLTDTLSQAIQAGDRVQIQCRAEGTPEPEIIWIKEGDMVENDTMDNNSMTAMRDFSVEEVGNGSATLVIASFEQQHEGTYVCYAALSDVMETIATVQLALDGDD